MKEVQIPAKAKHPGGRPRKYASPDELQTAIDMYFDEADAPTVTGLALALGFLSRQALINYEGYDAQFHDALKIAKLRVENSYEEAMRQKGRPTGEIFALKNFGWSDKQEIEHGGNLSVQLPGVQIIMPEMPKTDDAGGVQ